MALFKKGDKRPDDPQPVRVDVSFGDAVGKRARLAARSGDGGTIHGLVENAVDAHQREFLVYAALHGINRAPWIEQLPDQLPTSPSSWLIRGAHGIEWAWHSIGGAYRPSESASEDALRVCRERLEQAEADLVQATRLGEEDPTPWSLLVTTGYGLGLGFEEICNRFDQADQRTPWLFLAHLRMLQASCAKWAGNDETMFAFARDVAVNAPDGSPCISLIAAAHIEHWWARHEDDPSVALGQVVGAPEPRKELASAAGRSVASSRFVDDGSAVIARNVFAMALLEAGEADRAKAQVAAVRDRVSEYPWVYLDPDPGLAFARARQAVMPADPDM